MIPFVGRRVLRSFASPNTTLHNPFPFAFTHRGRAVAPSNLKRLNANYILLLLSLSRPSVMMAN